MGAARRTSALTPAWPFFRAYFRSLAETLSIHSEFFRILGFLGRHTPVSSRSSSWKSSHATTRASRSRSSRPRTHPLPLNLLLPLSQDYLSPSNALLITPRDATAVNRPSYDSTAMSPVPSSSREHYGLPGGHISTGHHQSTARVSAARQSLPEVQAHTHEPQRNLHLLARLFCGMFAPDHGDTAWGVCPPRRCGGSEKAKGVRGGAAGPAQGCCRDAIAADEARDYRQRRWICVW